MLACPALPAEVGEPGSVPEGSEGHRLHGERSRRSRHSTCRFLAPTHFPLPHIDPRKLHRPCLPAPPPLPSLPLLQIGTGVMVGLPGQTLRDLAGDLHFFRGLGADMIGMGPYITEAGTPVADMWQQQFGHVDKKKVGGRWVGWIGVGVGACVAGWLAHYVCARVPAPSRPCSPLIPSPSVLPLRCACSTCKRC